MADSDKILKLLIEIGVIGADDAKAAEQILEEAKGSTGELAKEMGVLNVSTTDVEKILKQTGATANETGKHAKDLGEKTEEAGEHAVSSRTKHMLLHHAFAELNNVIPGLGTIVAVLEHQMDAVGESAAASAVATKAAGVGAEAAGAGAAAATPAVAGFGATLATALAPVLPFIAAMLAIQEATNLWESFSESSKEAAEANAEACKKIQESTRDALKAVRELDEAMHPKEHNLAEKDEEALKKQQNDLENNFNRQKELNKVAQDNETKAATSPEQKEAIKAKYELADKMLEDWRAKQNAAIESSMAGSMDAQLKQLQEANDKIVEKMKARYQAGLASGDFSLYNESKAELEKNTAEAKAIREKRDDLGARADQDTGNAAWNSETNRQVFAGRGMQYGDQGLAIANAEATPQGQMLMQLAAATGKNNQQIQNLFAGLLNHTLNLGLVIEQLQWQLNQLQAQHANMRNSQGGQG